MVIKKFYDTHASETSSGGASTSDLSIDLSNGGCTTFDQLFAYPDGTNTKSDSAKKSNAAKVMKVLKMADAQLRHKDRSFAFSPLEAINKTLTNAGPISGDEYRDATNYLGQFLHDDADKVIPTILATATILSRGVGIDTHIPAIEKEGKIDITDAVSALQKLLENNVANLTHALEGGNREEHAIIQNVETIGGQDFMFATYPRVSTGSLEYIDDKTKMLFYRNNDIWTRVIGSMPPEAQPGIDKINVIAHNAELNTFLVQWTNNELHRSWFTSFTIPPQGEAKSTSLGSAHLHNDHYHIHNKESKLFLFVCGESGLLIVDSSGQKVFDIKHPCSDITSYEQACSALEGMKHEGNGTFKFALKRKWFERTVTLILDRLYGYHNSQGTITDENFKRARKYIKEINS